MREILFRGKRIKDGQWVYGYYVKATMHWHKHGIHEDFIVCNAIQNGGYFNFLGRYAVNPKTIGQYTGLTDKNGTKIFEGDIVLLCDDEEPYQVAFDECCFQVYDSGVCYDMDCFRSEDIEIIGNIYDNPELLKGDTK
jgi:uncharacterized phage protein (TIGR01671 family)